MLAVKIAFSFLLVVVSANVEVKVGMLHRAGHFKSSINEVFLFPATEIAMETIAKRLEDGEYMNFSMSLINSDQCCNRPVRSGGAVAASFHHDHSVDAFLGPPESNAMIPVADMAAYWNLPVVSGVSTSTLLDDKRRFQTLTRTSPDLSLLASFTSALFQRFKWQRCVILRGIRPRDSYYYRQIVPTAIFETLEETYGITVIEVFANQFATLDEALEKAASLADIIFLSTSPVVDVMVHAHRLGYTDGSHVFLYWYPCPFEVWKTNSQFENLNEESIEALKALLVMRMELPDNDEYHEFQDKLRARQMALYGEQENEETLFAATWHDAVLIYADVINEVVAEGGNVRDGRAITKKMWNRTFQGVTGKININENGDRYGCCEVLDLTDTVNGAFTVIGTFDEATNNLDLGDIKWAGGEARKRTAGHTHLK